MFLVSVFGLFYIKKKKNWPHIALVYPLIYTCSFVPLVFTLDFLFFSIFFPPDSSETTLTPPPSFFGS